MGLKEMLWVQRMRYWFKGVVTGLKELLWFKGVVMGLKELLGV